MNEPAILVQMEINGEKHSVAFCVVQRFVMNPLQYAQL